MNRVLAYAGMGALLATFAVGCGDSGSEGNQAGVSDNPSTDTEKLAVALRPSAPKTTDSLLAVTSAGVTFEWKRDGDSVDVTGAEVPPELTSKGEKWSVRVTRGDESASASTTIANTPPVFTSVLVALTSGGSSARCLAAAQDADEDDLTLSYAWYVDGEALEGQDSAELEASHYQSSGVVTCEATASDGEDETTARAANEVSPTAGSVSSLSAAVNPDPLYVCSAPTCEFSWSGEEPGGEYEYSWLLNDSVVAGTSGKALDGVSLAAGDEVGCVVRHRSGPNESWRVASSDVRTVENVLPSLTSVSLASVAVVGEELQCVVAGYEDADCESAPRFEYAWYVDEAPVNGGAFLDTTHLDPGASVRCEVTPTDGIDSGTTLASGEAQVVPDGFAIVGDLVDSRAGFSVAIVDDMNGDGLGDLVLGAPNAEAEVGRAQVGKVYVVHGQLATSDVLLANVAAGNGGFDESGELGGLQHSRFLCSRYGGSGCGGVLDIEDLDDTTHYMAGPIGDGFGFTVANLGDMNGDGVSDILASAPFAYGAEPLSGPNRSWRGKSYTLFGGHFGTASLQNLLHGPVLGAFSLAGQSSAIPGLGSSRGELFGYATVTGDFNGDGFADYAASSPLAYNSTGIVYVIAGGEEFHQIEARYTIDPNGHLIVGKSDEKLGIDLGRAGDFNGDGRDDFVLQSMKATELGIAVMYGGYPARYLYLEDIWAFLPGDADSPVRYVRNGENVMDGDSLVSGRSLSGWAVGGGGDVNGDGFDDVVVSAEGPGGKNGAYVVFGASSRDEVSLDDVAGGVGGFAIYGDFVTRKNDGDVKMGGDFNGDGLDDVVICSSTGYVDVVYGKTGDTTAVDLTDGVGAEEGFRFTVPYADAIGFGQSCDVGDIDGDGLADLLVGTPRRDGPSFNGAPRPDIGGAYVRFGREGAENADFFGGKGDDTFTGTSAAETFLSGAGSDVLIGGGGQDVFYAGPGDDVIEPGDIGYRRIDGGPGIDALRFTPSPSQFFLSDLLGRVRNVEALDFEDEYSTRLDVEAADVRRLSDTSNLLILKGTSTDSVGALATSWTRAGTANWSGTEFFVFESDGATLWVQVGMTTDFPPQIAAQDTSLAAPFVDGTFVVNAGGSDPDGGALTYLIADDGGHPGLFSIDSSTGDLTVFDADALTADSVGRYDLTIQVVDAAEHSASALVRISVQRTAPGTTKPPVFKANPASYFADEGVANGTIVGAVFARDPENSKVQYSIASGNGALSIDADSGVLRVADTSKLQHSQSPYVFVVSAIDQNGDESTTEVTLDVGDPLVTESNVRLLYYQPRRSIFNSHPGPSTLRDVTFNIAESERAAYRVTPVPGGQVEYEADLDGVFRVRLREEFGNPEYEFFVPVDVTFDFPAVTEGQSYVFTSSSTARGDAHTSTVWPQVTSICDVLLVGGVDALSEACVNASCESPETAYWGWSGTKELARKVTPEQTLVTNSLRDGLITRNLHRFDAIDTDAFVRSIGGPASKIVQSLSDPAGGPDLVAEVDLLNLFCRTERYIRMAPTITFTGLDATMTFTESNQQISFRIGSNDSRTVPVGADANHDGVIQYSLRLDFVGGYNQHFETNGNANLGVNAGSLTLSTLREVDDPDYFPERTFGPLVEQINYLWNYKTLYAQYIAPNTNSVVLRGSLQVQ